MMRPKLWNVLPSDITVNDDPHAFNIRLTMWCLQCPFLKRPQAESCYSVLKIMAVRLDEPAAMQRNLIYKCKAYMVQRMGIEAGGC